MTNIRVVTPSQLDYSAFVALQRTAFAEVISGTGTDYLLCEEYYRWKYDAPEGEARIALIYEGDELLATNAMYPLRVAARDASLRAWQSCDTATHPRARGRGCFLRCLSALRALQQPDEIFFGFGNKTSTPGLLKFGWTMRSDVNTWIRVLPGGRTSTYPAVTPIAEFGPDDDTFARALTAAGGPLLDRGAAYMEWRYRRHPLHAYDAFAWIEGGRQLGVLVMRRVELSGRVFGIALELLALEPRIEHALLAYAAAWSREHGLRYTAVLNNTLRIGTGLRHAYVPIPRWVLPKRQVLTGAANGGPTAERIWHQDWRVQIGDWDVF